MIHVGSLLVNLRAALQARLPCACLLCGAGCHAPGLLCACCMADLPRLEGSLCPICAAPIGQAASACGECLRRPPPFDATQAALRYAFPVDRLVQLLKFGGGQAMRRLASADFFATTLCAGPHPEGDLMVPVPLSPVRLRERGFNQALEIARPLARVLALPLDVTRLVRVRDTHPQSALPWRVRARNVRHAFEYRGDLAGKSVIVVDDVMTTGATLAAVARTLKDHGAVRVINWVAARTVKG